MAVRVICWHIVIKLYIGYWLQLLVTFPHSINHFRFSLHNSVMFFTSSATLRGGLSCPSCACGAGTFLPRSFICMYLYVTCDFSLQKFIVCCSHQQLQCSYLLLNSPQIQIIRALNCNSQMRSIKDTKTQTLFISGSGDVFQN